MCGAYDLQIQRHDCEVQHLHSRPDYEICLESGEVSVRELVKDITTATT